MPKSILTFITHRIIQFCRLSLSLMSVFWFDFDGTKTKKLANDQAKLLIGQGKPKKTFCRTQWRINKKKKTGWHFPTEKHEKIHKISRNDLRAFALRNYSEDYKINKPLWPAGVSEDNAQGWMIVSTVKFSQSPSNLRFPANCSFLGQSLSLGHYPTINQSPKGV